MQRQKETIVLTLDNENVYKNPFNENKLSDALSNYILEECKGFDYNSEIEIHIKTNFDVKREEKISIINMIRSSYVNDIKENDVYMNHLIRRNIVFFLGGCLFTAYSFVIEKASPILSEIVLIIGWIGIWEVVYSIFFSESKKRMEKKRLRQLANSKIIFFK